MKYHTIMVELTTKCNMRCIYCEVSHPHWKPRDMSNLCIQKIIDFVKRNGVHYVCLHGHGEMTVVPDWHKIADRFLSAGAKLTTCTNLNKTFSTEEIQTLAKFASITISLDAIDVELFRALRRGGDIRNLLYNMAMIQTAANQKENEIYWIWDVVVCNKNIHELLNICKLAVTFNVKTITFCNLVKLSPPIPSSAGLLHPREMSPHDIYEAISQVRKCRDYCDSNGVQLICSSILESLGQDA